MADRRYETLVLIHPDQGEPGAHDVVARIKKLVEEQGSALSQVQEWGSRDLAYPVAKQRRGFYALFEYRAGTKGLLEIERNLTLMDPVLRFVSIHQDEKAPPAPARHLRKPEEETVVPEDEAGGFGEGEGV